MPAPAVPGSVLSNSSVRTSPATSPRQSTRASSARALAGLVSGGFRSVALPPNKLLGLPWELLYQPFKHFELVRSRRPSQLSKQFVCLRPLESDVRGALVTDGADGAKVGGIIGATERLINDVTDVEACLLPSVVGMWLACRSTAHLTGVAVSVQYKRPCFLGDGTLERRAGCERLKPVLTWLETAVVIVSSDVHAVLVTKLTHSTTPLARSSDRSQLIRVKDPTYVGFKVRPQLGSGSGLPTACPCC